MKSFVLELRDSKVFYINETSEKRAALKALLISDEESSEIYYLIEERTGRRVINIKLDYQSIHG